VSLKNPKHEHFAQIVSNGESPARAYVLAGYSENGAAQSANRLLMNAEICSRIAELRKEKELMHSASVAQVVESAGIDKAWVMAKLVRVVELGMQAEIIKDDDGKVIGDGDAQNLAAANKALELIGKEFAMFIDRKEVRTGPLDDLAHEDLKALYEALTALAAPIITPATGDSGTRH
jgi:phage terminase small subunit